MKHKSSFSTFRVIVSLAQKDRLRLGISLCFLVVSGLLEAFSIISILPIISLALGPVTTQFGTASQSVLDFFLSLGIDPTVPNLLAAIVCGIVLKAFVLLFANQLIGVSAVNYAAELRMKLIQGLLQTRWLYFTAQSTGRFTNALTNEIDQLAALYMAILTFFSMVILVLVYGGLALFVSWRMFLGASFVGLIMVLILKVIMKKTQIAGQKQVDAMQKLNYRLVDCLNIIKPLKAMAQEQKIAPFIFQPVQGLKHSRQRLVLLSNITRFSQEPIITLFLALGIYAVSAQMTLNATEFLFSLLVYYRMVSQIGTVQSTFQKVASQEETYWSIQRLFEEIFEQKENLTQGHAQRLLFQTQMEFKNVSFSYGAGPVLKDLNLCIPARRLICLTGPSGAGKTTLIDLVLALIEPQQGEILLDGQALHEQNLIHWRQQIGFVPQDSILANDTLFNNLTLYDTSISEEDVLQALKAAEALEFVERLPLGLQSPAGERGALFSGGQKQRLSIARAILRKPSLLILDEPTSALDPKTEQDLCKTLKKLSKSTTIIAISHQKALIEASDVVIDLGARNIVNAHSSCAP